MIADPYQLLANNRRWAERMQATRPGFFARLECQQSPSYLWIGCSDSRVPANELIGMDPGEVFVHRNIGNVVAHGDLNCLSVIQFAVEVLQVRHIIVTGHYDCGGVKAALSNQQGGLIDNWLRHIKDVHAAHAAELAAITDPTARANRLCELNVAAQVRHVCATASVQNAWARGAALAVHGWIYGVGDGLLHDLGVTATGPAAVDPLYRYMPPTA